MWACAYGAYISIYAHVQTTHAVCMTVHIYVYRIHTYTHTTSKCFDMRVCICGIYVYIYLHTHYKRSVHICTYTCIPNIYIHAHYFKVFWCVRVHMRRMLFAWMVCMSVCVYDMTYSHVWDHTFLCASRVKCSDDVCAYAYGAYICIYTYTHTTYAVCIFVCIHVFRISTCMHSTWKCFMCARTYGVYGLCLDGVYDGVCVTLHIHVWDYTFLYLSRVECFDDMCVCAYGAYIRIYTCTHAAYAVCMFLYIHVYHVWSESSVLMMCVRVCVCVCFCVSAFECALSRTLMMGLAHGGGGVASQR